MSVELLDHVSAIAIVGMAGRFPGASNLTIFEKNLADARESITFFSKDELLAQGLDPALVEHPEYVRAAPMLAEHDFFDPGLFGIAASEAEIMDPQHRVFLECAFEALEHAGYGGIGGNRSVGVYGGAGSIMGSYLVPNHGINERLVGFIASREHIGNDKDHLCTRVAHRLDLRGPSVTVQTACSTSLVAVHMACRSILSGECEMALAGGVTIRNPQRAGYMAREGDIFSPDGHCRTFDVDAAGTLFGSGVGVVVLKSLRQAIADGDTIHAVIRGSAINNDGGDKFSYWSTSPKGQTDAITKALSAAKVAAETIGYVEAHGTATRIGDLMETHALKNAFASERRSFCGIGSVKTNIGHTDAASGIAGLLKALLSLRSRRLFANLHFKTPNPRIKFADGPFYVVDTTRPFKVTGHHPRRAAVNSLGVGGTNAHVILEEAPPRPSLRRAPRPISVLPVSAGNEEALNQLTKKMYTHVLVASPTSCTDICLTAAAGRRHYETRICAIGSTPEALAESVATSRPRTTSRRARPGTRAGPKIAFLFSGQGAQYLGMGRELYTSEPIFRAAMDACEALFQPLLGSSLLEVMHAVPDEEAAHSLLDETGWTQPALFMIEYALAKMWMAWGVEPDIVLGHSVGEFAAACIAGVMSLEDSVKLIATRARLMQALPRGGAMAAVRTSPTQVLEALAQYGDDSLTLAAINGPESVVVSGPQQAVENVLESLQNAGIRCKRLAVSHAFHSPLVEPMLADLTEAAGELTFQAPKRMLISNLTGEHAEPTLIDAGYWGHHARKPVRFADALNTASAAGARLFIEIGPGTTLLGLSRNILENQDASSCWLPSLSPRRGEAEQVSQSLAELYTRGVNIKWDVYTSSMSGAGRIPIPTYPFQRERYWLAPAPHRPAIPRIAVLVDRCMRSPRIKETVFETVLSVDAFPFLDDHRVQDRVVAPGALYISMVLACARVLDGTGSTSLEDIIFPQPLLLDDGPRCAQLIVTPGANPSESAFELLSLAEGNLVDTSTHATGQLAKAPFGFADGGPSPQAISERLEAVDFQPIYEIAARRGIVFGPAFRWFEAAYRGEGEGLGKLRAPTVVHNLSDHRLHPGLLDACFQLASTLVDRPERNETLLPFAIGSLQLLEDAGAGPWWCHVRAIEPLVWDITLHFEDGRILARIERFQMRAADTLLAGEARWKQWLYAPSWEPRALFGVQGTLPQPAVLAGAVARLAQTKLSAPILAQHETALAALEPLSVDYILSAFSRVGAGFRAGSQILTAQLARQIGVLPLHQRLFERLVAILSEEGILEPAGDGRWSVVRTPTFRDPSAHHRELVERFGALIEPELELLARCGHGLDGVLRGTTQPLELLFPRSDLTTASRLYNQTPRALAINGIILDTILALFDKLPPGQGLRILEIGGGTGGTTATLLPSLPAERVRYTFTDIGKVFVNRARERFIDYTFLTGRPLDIGADPIAQGFEPHAYDLVVAVNVLHATPEMATTMGHVRKLLAPGGHLLLSDSTKRSRWIDLIFGLTPEWWCFRDARQDHPLLTVESWMNLLPRCGFVRPQCIPDASPALAQQGQIVIVAQADDSSMSMQRRWLLVGDSRGPGPALADLLSDAGNEALFVSSGRAVDDDGSEATFVADDPDVLVNLLSRAEPFQDVVYLDALANPGPPADADTLAKICERDCQGLLSLTKVLLNACPVPPNLWVVTRAAQAVTPGDPVHGFAHATLWGMGKVIALEHPELGCTLVDLDGQLPNATQLAALAGEMRSASVQKPRETHVALRARGTGIRRWVSRVCARPNLGETSGPRKLVSDQRGTLDGLVYQPLTRRPPGSGEVELRVAAIGLNFIDVLDVLGMLPFERDNELGSECTGVVVNLGEGVDRFSVGDRVAAMAWGCMGSHVTVDARRVSRIPEGLSDEDVATVPISYGTATLALLRAARLQPGDRVLVHAASGGTGMAAVALAREAGAIVYGTASRPKWDAVRTAGVTEVYNSRDLDFADQLLRDTNGRGVDVVLNSLTGEGFVERSLDVLAPNGRFVEIGKRGIWTTERVHAHRPDVDYQVVDLRGSVQADPAVAGSLLDDILRRVAAAELPPLPASIYPIEQAQAAFRLMQQARHVGKIVLKPQPSQAVSIRGDGTYVITGGLGGLGLRVARWLAETGARHIALLGRHRPTPAQKHVLAQIREMPNVTVTTICADVTDAPALASAIAEAGSTAPVRGVIHAPGVLDDGALLGQNWSRYARVLGPKVWGAWNLHAATVDCPLDFFVLFSSVAGILGNPGQSNHAAANTFLDALAHYRLAAGQVAQTIDWGPWADIGAAASGELHPDTFIPPGDGIAVLAQILESRAPHAVVLPSVTNYLSNREPEPFLSQLVDKKSVPVAQQPPQSSADFTDTWTQTEPQNRRALLLQMTRDLTAKVLGIQPAKLGLRQGLRDLGLDSLMSIELRNRLATSFERRLPATLVFDYPTLEAIVDFLYQDVFEQRSECLPEPTPPPDTSEADTLSQDEAAALLEQELERMGF